jgi:hypothetical protein
MSQIWYSSEIVYEELLKIAKTMLWRRMRDNSIAIERFGDTLPQLAIDVVVATIERMLELEQREPTTNLMARCYRVMYFIVREQANRLWKQPRIDFTGEELPEPAGGPAAAGDRSIESVIDRIAFDELQQLVSTTLPRLYEETVEELYNKTRKELVRRPEFLRCVKDRLNGNTARGSWKPFADVEGGSWQNMEKLYVSFRETLRRRLKPLGAESLIGLEIE